MPMYSMKLQSREDKATCLEEFRREYYKDLFKYAVCATICRLRGIRSRSIDGHNYIVLPMKEHLVERIRSEDPSKPRLDWYIKSKLELRVSNVQFGALLSIKKCLDSFKQHQDYMMHRPKVPILGHAQEWWQYTFLMIRQRYLNSFTANLIEMRREARLRKNFIEAKIAGEKEMIEQIFLDLPINKAVEYTLSKNMTKAQLQKMNELNPTNMPSMDSNDKTLSGTIDTLDSEATAENNADARNQKIRIDCDIRLTLAVKEPRFGLCFFGWDRMLENNEVYWIIIPRISILAVERQGNFSGCVKNLELEIPRIEAINCIEPRGQKIEKMLEVKGISAVVQANTIDGSLFSDKNMKTILVTLGEIKANIYLSLLRDVVSMFHPILRASKSEIIKIEGNYVDTTRKLQSRIGKLLGKVGFGTSGDVRGSKIEVLLLDQYNKSYLVAYRAFANKFGIQYATTGESMTFKTQIPWKINLTLQPRSDYPGELFASTTGTPLSNMSTYLSTMKDPTTPVQMLVKATQQEAQRLRDYIKSGAEFDKYDRWDRFKTRRLKFDEEDGYLYWAKTSNKKFIDIDLLNRSRLHILDVKDIRLGFPEGEKRSEGYSRNLYRQCMRADEVYLKSHVDSHALEEKFLTLVHTGGILLFRSKTAQISSWWRDGLKAAHARAVEEQKNELLFSNYNAHSGNDNVRTRITRMRRMSLSSLRSPTGQQTRSLAFNFRDRLQLWGEYSSSRFRNRSRGDHHSPRLLDRLRDHI